MTFRFCLQRVASGTTSPICHLVLKSDGIPLAPIYNRAELMPPFGPPQKDVGYESHPSALANEPPHSLQFWYTARPLDLPRREQLRVKANDPIFGAIPVCVCPTNDVALPALYDALGEEQEASANERAPKRRKLQRQNARPQAPGEEENRIPLRTISFIVANSSSALLSCAKPCFRSEDARIVPQIKLLDYHYPWCFFTQDVIPDDESEKGFKERPFFPPNSASKFGRLDPLISLDSSEVGLRDLHIQVLSDEASTQGWQRIFGFPTRQEVHLTKTWLQISEAFWKRCTVTADHNNIGLYRFDCTLYGSAGLAWRMILPKRDGEFCLANNIVAETLLAHPVPRISHVGRFREMRSRMATWWTSQSFYDCVHVPEFNNLSLPDLQNDLLRTPLYPFQQRAVAWLLSREGVKPPSNGTTLRSSDEPPCPSFKACSDARGKRIYVSSLLNSVMTEKHKQEWNAAMLQGGILAEEMGLGKTVELIALMCLHKRTADVGQVIPDEFSKTDVTGSRATLIITPPSILGQWKNELATHAPNLMVYHYGGVKHEGDMSSILNADVVLTTYTILSKEIHYAKPQVDRKLRTDKKYEVRRSPLVRISWWRVCLDEAQMIEGGISNAALVARQIPRCNSWAVSGTPFKRNIHDLQGLLLFLRFEPFCDDAIWNRMLSHDRDAFVDIFSSIALRHTKESVRSELRLPPQKRVVISVPFAAIEEQHYSHLFQQMCDDCGLDQEGAPLKEDWDPNSQSTVERMRSWLTRLRQTCLHPEIGGRNRKALGRSEGPPKTLHEVLDVMIEQNDNQLRIEERAVLAAQAKQAHLYSFAKQPQQSLKIYLACLRQVHDIVRECRSSYESEKLRAKIEVAGRTVTLDTNDSRVDHDPESEDKNGKLNGISSRLRLALELQHTCTFFLANSYYQIKTDNSLTVEDSDEFHELEKKETETYEAAKRIRTELLTEVSGKALKFMNRVKTSRDKEFVTVPKVDRFENARGIESRKIVEQVAELQNLLNTQAEKLEEWRKQLTDRLLASLLDQDDTELTGEEYEETTIRQDEQYAYLDVLRALIADRNTIITGQPNLLVNYEMKEALRLANDGNGPAPDLMKACLAERNLLICRDGLSIRGVIADLRHLITSVRWQSSADDRGRGPAESLILERELQNLQAVQSEQSKVTARLEQELDLFRATMNSRLDYYRQVQQISDAVAPLQEEATDRVDEVAMTREGRAEHLHREKLATLRTKRRFLQHLQADSTGQAEKLCTICQEQFEVGVLTVCGHQYCKECIQLWYNQHKTCPICKRHLTLRDFHDVTYKPRDLVANVESQSPSAKRNRASSQTEDSSRDAVETVKDGWNGASSIYSRLPASTLNTIQSIALRDSFGTKIDTISRHIIYLRDADPGAKSIIFSQYRDFLNVLGSAFTRFKIGYADIAAKDGIKKFLDDPSAECFLLHAKADSSGLNLVNATHVFLSEPLVNAALELQAIARVHRIGQKRTTTVWMYLAQDSVEESIYDISVKRRLEYVRSTRRQSLSAGDDGKGKSKESNSSLEDDLEDADSGLLRNTPNVTSLMSKGVGGGEIVGKDDLWQCLFGRASSRARGWGADNSDAAMQGSVTATKEVGRFLRAEAMASRVSK